MKKKMVKGSLAGSVNAILEGADVRTVIALSAKRKMAESTDEDPKKRAERLRDALRKKLDSMGSLTVKSSDVDWDYSFDEGCYPSADEEKFTSVSLEDCDLENVDGDSSYFYVSIVLPWHVYYTEEDGECTEDLTNDVLYALRDKIMDAVDFPLDYDNTDVADGELVLGFSGLPD